MATRFTAPLCTVLLFVVAFLGATMLLSAADIRDARKPEPPHEADKPQIFEGHVLPLADVVKNQSAKADEDGLKVARVLKTNSGKIFSLVKDEASRKFFMDERLLSRPMRITAVQIPGTQMLVIKQAQSIVNGKLHDVDYWCEKCQLAYTEPGICKCCGSPTELRELSVETP